MLIGRLEPISADQLNPSNQHSSVSGQCAQVYSRRVWTVTDLLSYYSLCPRAAAILTATSIAANILSSLALPVPAMSKAVP